MKIKIYNIIKLVTLGLFAGLFFGSCLVVKKADKDDRAAVNSFVYSPKPELPMSDELIRSKKGDMIALLPKDWFLVDVEEKASSDIFAVAVNPDYTLSAVFSNFRVNEINKDVIAREGLLGLARLSMDKHAKKTGGNLKQAGKYATIKMGNMQYAQYEYLNDSPSPSVRVAVFISNQNECYEFALVPLTFRGNKFPANNEIDAFFKSILATIQY